MDDVLQLIVYTAINGVMAWMGIFMADRFLLVLSGLSGAVLSILWAFTLFGTKDKGDGHGEKR